MTEGFQFGEPSFRYNQEVVWKSVLEFFKPAFLYALHNTINETVNFLALRCH